MSEKERLNLIITFLQTGSRTLLGKNREATLEEVLLSIQILIQAKPVHFVEAILPFISFRQKHAPGYQEALDFLRAELDQFPEHHAHKAFIQLRKKMGGPAAPLPPSAPDDAEFETALEEGEAIFIKNAGIVILWPFFRRLFSSLQLVDEKGKFLGEDQQIYAAHLLEYAATRKTVTPEFLMPLNKILCEIPFSTPLPPEIELGEDAKAMVESLLRAVIQQWTAVKNTSEDGLRGNFFIRDGKLFKKEKNWTLVVEQKSYDLLLDRLPWGINTIKLPWMTPILYVDWR